MTRGLRLNNPCNIRISSNPWQGKITPSQDSEFETFDTPEHGIRAGAKIIHTYFQKYQLDTIRKIINRWAPSSENDTQAYITAVSDRVGLDPDAFLDLTDPALFTSLMIAIIHQEQGQEPYQTAEILTAIDSVLT